MSRPDGTLFALAARAAAVAPDRHAVLGVDRGFTFAELERTARAMAAALRARGVGPGDRVALVAKSRADSVALLLACARVGAVLVAVNDRLADDEVRWIVDDAACALALVEARFRPATGATPTVELGPEPWWDPAADDGDPTPADVVLQLYTSGTSGRPKGARLTHANWRAILDAWTPLMELEPGARFLQVTPFFHVGGILMVLACLREAVTLHLHPAFDPALCLDALEAERITHTLLVPSMVEWVLREPGVDARDLGALRLVVYGAAPMNTDTLRRAASVFGARFLQGYGLTETAGVALALEPSDHLDALEGRISPERLASAGRPIASCEVRVVDEAFRDAELGEIVVRGESVFGGYWARDGDAPREAWTDDWFHTGDVGRIDADGCIHVVDRIKDMVLVGGENVYPREVERVLLEHEGVADAAALGAPHDVWGEVVVAFVVAAGDAPTERELVRWCRARLAHFKCPTRVRFVGVLPRNAAGKILKRDLRAALENPEENR
ncbi:MAG: AMP-binding protein [Planctomycetota bacterium]